MANLKTGALDDFAEWMKVHGPGLDCDLQQLAEADPEIRRLKLEADAAYGRWVEHLNRLRDATSAFLNRPQVCRGCGCTDRHACIDEHGLPCHWIAIGLCSACSDEPRDAETYAMPPGPRCLRCSHQPNPFTVDVGPRDRLQAHCGHLTGGCCAGAPRCEFEAGALSRWSAALERFEYWDRPYVMEGAGPFDGRGLT